MSKGLARHSSSFFSFLAISAALIGLGANRDVPAQPTSPTGTEYETILGGGEDPCDGYDNDGDGATDEGCYRECNAWGKPTPDLRITNDVAHSDEPSLVWTGSGYGVAWQDDRLGHFDVFFALLDSLGNKKRADVEITTDAEAAGNPSLVWLPDWVPPIDTTFAVAYQKNEASGVPQIFFQYIAQDGSLSGSPYKIAGAFGYGAMSPSLVAHAGQTIPFSVAWQDYRHGPSEIYFRQWSWSSQGPEIRVTNDSSTSEDPSLVWTGSEYGLAWSEGRAGNLEIYFARLDGTGTKIGADVRVTNATGASVRPSLVFTGTGYAIAWEDVRDGNSEIYFARLDAAGNRIGADVRVTNDAAVSGRPSLAWANGEYGVAWQDARDGSPEIYFAKITATGGVIGTALRVTSDPASSLSPSLAWNGSTYATAWHDLRAGGVNSEIYVAHIQCCIDDDLDGYSECSGDCNDADPGARPGGTEACDGKDNNCDGAVDEACDAICDDPERAGADVVVASSATISSIASAWTGSEHGVAWAARDPALDSVRFVRTDAQGNRIGDVVTVVSNTDGQAYGEVNLVWTGSGYGLAWRRGGIGTEQVYFVRLDPSGAKLGVEIRVDTAGGDEPSLAWSGTEFAIVWVYRYVSYEGEHFRFARIDASGNRVGPEVVLEDGVQNRPYEAPSLAWSGNGYGIAWIRYYTFEYRRVSFGLLDRHGHMQEIPTACYSQQSPFDTSLVWSGQGFALAWREYESATVSPVYLCRMNADGTMIGETTSLSFKYSVPPSLVWTGGEYGVTASDAPSIYTERVLFHRVDASGVKVQPSVPVSGVLDWVIYTSALWTGVNYGVFWTQPGVADQQVAFNRVACCDNVDGDGFNECHECADADPAVFPGAPQLCDGKNNDCSDPSWPAVPANEADADGDQYRVCANDCDDTDPTRYPGSPELNDGRDNQCPGEPGHGMIDELAGGPVFGAGGDASVVSWAEQSGASSYELARCSNPRFDADCVLVRTFASSPWWRDPEIPAPQQAFYYLIHPLAPFPGSWGESYDGGQARERLLACTDTVDEFTFVDHSYDDIGSTALLEFFATIVATPQDYMLFEIEKPPLNEINAWCALGADFYTTSYLMYAPGGGYVVSNGLPKWFRNSSSTGDAWVGPIATGYQNTYGPAGGYPFSWRSEYGLGGLASRQIHPYDAQCEVSDPYCNSLEPWRLRIRVGPDRASVCGF